VHFNKQLSECGSVGATEKLLFEQEYADDAYGAQEEVQPDDIEFEEEVQLGGIEFEEDLGNPVDKNEPVCY
jgi:hypothetical protein